MHAQRVITMSPLCTRDDCLPALWGIVVPGLLQT